MSRMPNIASMVLSDPASQLAKRPGFGTIGKEVKARVNFFKLNIAGAKTIISYAAEHKETANKREVRRRITQRTDSLLLNDPRFRHAASNYSDRFLSQEGAVLIRPGQTSHEHIVDFYDVEESGPRQGDRQLRISVVVKQEGIYPIAPFQTYVNDPSNSNFPRIDEYIAVFNTLVDRVVSEDPDLATYARRTKFFDTRTNNGRVTLGDGLEAFKGYFKSVRDCIDGLFLNINTSACAMFRQGRLDVVMRELPVPGRFLGPVLKGVRVKTTYSGQPRNRAISGIAPPNDRLRPPTADNVLIPCPQHGSETVDQHFRRAWPTVQRPNPAAFVIDFGNKVYIPSDLCEVLPGNAYRGALTGNQTTNMINFACRKPKQNRELILREGVPFLRFGTAGGPSERFGINLANAQPEMLEVIARLLPAPKISFAGGKGETFSNGAWNLRGKKFTRSATDSWVKVSYLDLRRSGTPPCQNINDLINGMNGGIRQYLGSNSRIQTFTDFNHARELPQGMTANDLAKALRGAFGILLDKGIRLVLVVLPDKEVSTYYAVKKAGDLLAGIHTICTVRDDKANVKSDIGFVANLMLKLNQKLGGINSTLQPLPGYNNLLGGNTMIVGADMVSGDDTLRIGRYANPYRLILVPALWWVHHPSQLSWLQLIRPSFIIQAVSDCRKPKTRIRRPLK
ncbi:hypothetical protein PMZ80_001765 [Knufia obscura]|uniref:Piwi domain-containing protein n=1 Tax=Knufia obscura TaxID=1635080 RepID=A0ABR0S417_9EURO|nr:hypothetical protein PMZ80_001765 [Knufia obscura]